MAFQGLASPPAFARVAPVFLNAETAANLNNLNDEFLPPAGASDFQQGGYRQNLNPKKLLGHLSSSIIHPLKQHKYGALFNENDLPRNFPPQAIASNSSPNPFSPGPQNKERRRKLSEDDYFHNQGFTPQKDKRFYFQQPSKRDREEEPPSHFDLPQSSSKRQKLYHRYQNSTFMPEKVEPNYVKLLENLTQRKLSLTDHHFATHLVKNSKHTMDNVKRFLRHTRLFDKQSQTGDLLMDFEITNIPQNLEELYFTALTQWELFTLANPKFADVSIFTSRPAIQRIKQKIQKLLNSPAQRRILPLSRIKTLVVFNFIYFITANNQVLNRLLEYFGWISHNLPEALRKEISAVDPNFDFSRFNFSNIVNPIVESFHILARTQASSFHFLKLIDKMLHKDINDISLLNKLVKARELFRLPNPSDLTYNEREKKYIPLKLTDQNKFLFNRQWRHFEMQKCTMAKENEQGLSLDYDPFELQEAQNFVKGSGGKKVHSNELIQPIPKTPFPPIQ